MLFAKPMLQSTICELMAEVIETAILQPRAWVDCPHPILAAANP
jgi:hypothetical protein